MGVSFIRKTFIVANWKMNKMVKEAEDFCRDLLPQIEDCNHVDIAICPPFTSLGAVNDLLINSKVLLGGQDVSWEKQGAYTGEVSASMLNDVGCQYVLVGHSERREIIGETDEIVRLKLQRAIEAGLIPIFCVGEDLAARDNNRASDVIKKQLTAGLKNLEIISSSIVIAYEPIWAIGTGSNASPSDAQEMALFIRHELENIFDKDFAQNIIILYGGSVKEDNLADFLQEEDVDGALVGGASLEANSFAKLVRIGANGQ